jgi:Flp pilus assembly pilin Flp
MIKLYSFFESFLAQTKDEEGQTMAEYAIILAVIVVAVLATLVYLQGGIKSTLSSVTKSL